MTKTLEAHLDGIIGTIEDADLKGIIKKEDYIEVLRNNIENFKSQYWDVNKYEEKLKQYETN